MLKMSAYMYIPYISRHKCNHQLPRPPRRHVESMGKSIYYVSKSHTHTVYIYTSAAATAPMLLSQAVPAPRHCSAQVIIVQGLLSPVFCGGFPLECRGI